MGPALVEPLDNSHLGALHMHNIVLECFELDSYKLTLPLMIISVVHLARGYRCAIARCRLRLSAFPVSSWLLVGVSEFCCV